MNILTMLLPHVQRAGVQNALRQPEEPRFRRVRQRNTAFQQRAGRFRGALDILQVAGFVQEQQGQEEPSLALKRNDPGLLWLALSAVTSALPDQATARAASPASL